MVNLSAVASHARVSKATASRVLSGRGLGLVAPETTQRIQWAARELGYQINPIASALTTGKTRVVALWMPNLYRPYYAMVMHELCMVAHAAHYELIVAHSGATNAPQWPVDGIIAHDLPALPTQERAQNTPLVVIGEWPLLEVDSVRFDLVTATQTAVEHLIAQGCRQIAYIRQEEVVRHPTGRFTTYVETLARHGQAPQHIPVTEDTSQAGYEAILRFMRDGGQIDGIFCHNDEIALGAAHALHELGRRLPEDVKLVGCDDLESSRFIVPPLSSIRIPIREVAQTAWAFLEARIQAPDIPRQHVTLPAVLIPRLSSLYPNQQELNL
jgi:LacI family transcriptional regulator